MTDEVHYFGARLNGECRVWRVESVHGGTRRLDMRLDIWSHSPTGPEWGYAGSGPAQLALAILLDALGDDSLAKELHQHYKREVICGLHRERWIIFRHEVRAWMLGAVRQHGRRVNADGSPYLDYLADPLVDLTGPHVPPAEKGGGA